MPKTSGEEEKEMTEKGLCNYRRIIVAMFGLLAVICGNEPEIAMTDMAMACFLDWILQPENYWRLIPPQA